MAYLEALSANFAMQDWKLFHSNEVRGLAALHRPNLTIVASRRFGKAGNFFDEVTAS
jgi:hypothetical protein